MLFDVEGIVAGLCLGGRRVLFGEDGRVSGGLVLLSAMEDDTSENLRPETCPSQAYAIGKALS